MYNGKVFRSVANTDNGEVDAATTFWYQQDDNLVWAEYGGGPIRKGFLLAKADEQGRLDMTYQHLNTDGEFRSGVCRSTPEILPDGRIRLHEEWRWTSGDGSSGASVIEEVV